MMKYHLLVQLSATEVTGNMLISYAKIRSQPALEPNNCKAPPQKAQASTLSFSKHQSIPESDSSAGLLHVYFKVIHHLEGLIY